MIKEIWKPIPETNGDYEVSNTGKVRNFRTGKVLKPRPTKRGYFRVHIPINGKRKDAYIHRIVADRFCIHIPGNDVVNHIDNDVQNNTAENLEWTTQLGNVHHGMKQKRYRLNARSVIGCKNGETIKYVSAHQAAEGTGCDYSTIIKCCKGKKHATHGYTWKYAEVV